MFDDFFMKSFYNLNLIITNEKTENGEKKELDDINRQRRQKKERNEQGTLNIKT
jgi:hypothetical protein